MSEDMHIPLNANSCQKLLQLKSCWLENSGKKRGGGREESSGLLLPLQRTREEQAFKFFNATVMFVRAKNLKERAAGGLCPGKRRR